MAAGPTVVNPDAVEIIMQIPSLTNLDQNANELKGNTVQFSFWCQGSNMTDFAQIGGDTINAKFTYAYQKSYICGFAGEPPWVIQVRRDSVDFTEDNQTGDTYVYSYSAIYDQQLQYLNTAAMAILIDASQFGQSLPVRSYDVLGLVVEVPSNYDPLNRTYTGIWDGTFQNAWTNNPAWVIYALLTNHRWGLGRQIQDEWVDKWALYTIAQYCDERVPNGYGGVECRFSFNGVIATQQDAYTVINAVASCFRGMAYWAAGAVSFSCDQPTGYTDEANQAGAYSTPVAVFGPANVLNGDFTYEGTAAKARHSIALITWNDPRNNYLRAIEAVEVTELIERYGQRIIRATAYGCTTQSQAHRFGLWILASEQFETETVTFTTGLDYADVVPGSIIGIADPHRTGNTWAGRVIGSYISQQQIQLDRNFEFDISLSYCITYENPSGEGVISREIASFGTSAGGPRIPIPGLPGIMFALMARCCPPIPRRSMRSSASGFASSGSSWIGRRRTLPARPSRRSTRRCAGLPCRLPRRVQPLAVSPPRQRRLPLESIFGRATRRPGSGRAGCRCRVTRFSKRLRRGQGGPTTRPVLQSVHPSCMQAIYSLCRRHPVHFALKEIPGKKKWDGEGWYWWNETWPIPS